MIYNVSGVTCQDGNFCSECMTLMGDHHVGKPSAGDQPTRPSQPSNE